MLNYGLLLALLCDNANIAFDYLIVSSDLQIHRQVLSKFKCKGSINDSTEITFYMTLLGHIILHITIFLGSRRIVSYNLQLKKFFYDQKKCRSFSCVFFLLISALFEMYTAGIKALIW